MLRILVFDEPFTLTLRMEGSLDSRTLPEFYRSVAIAGAQLGKRKFLADVGDLALEGEDAEAALIEAKSKGVRFFGYRGRIAAALERQEEQQCRDRCSRIRRIGFLLSNRCKRSPRPFCLKLYRILHQIS